MDASAPMPDNLFAPPMHSTTPAGALSYDEEIEETRAPSHRGSDSALRASTMGGGSGGPSSASVSSTPFVAGGRPAPGTKISQSSVRQEQASTPNLSLARAAHAVGLPPTSSQQHLFQSIPASGPSAGPSRSKALPPTPDQLYRDSLLNVTSPASSTAAAAAAAAATVYASTGAAPVFGTDIYARTGHEPAAYPLLTPTSDKVVPPMKFSSSPQSLIPDPLAQVAPAPEHGTATWPPVHAVGGAAAAAAYLHAPPSTDLPPPRPPKTLTIRTGPTPMLPSIPIPPLPSPAHGLQLGAHAPEPDMEATPLATVPPVRFPPTLPQPAQPQQGLQQQQPPSWPQPGSMPPTGPGVPAQPTRQPPTAELPTYASLVDTNAAPPTFDQAAPGESGGGRFPRWRGWLEKRDLERRYAAMEDAAQAAAEGRVSRKKSWGAGVHDADALPYDGEEEDDEEDDASGDSDETTDEEEEGTHELLDEGSSEEDEACYLVNGVRAEHTHQDAGGTARATKRRRKDRLPPLHSHHFGSRFLPHLPSQPLCAVFLDIPPKPTAPILAVASAPSANKNVNGANTGAPRAGHVQVKLQGASRAKTRTPQARTAILIGTAEGLFAVELARPARRRRRGNRAGRKQAGTSSMSDGELEGGRGSRHAQFRSERAAESDTETGLAADGGGGGTGLDADEEEADVADAASGWNGRIRVVQVWSGLGVFQLSVLRSRPPPSAIFGPEGIKLGPSPRRGGGGNAFMSGFAGFSGMGQGGGSGQNAGAVGAGAGASVGAIMLALTAPAPAAHASAAALTRISPHANTLLENAETASSGGDRRHHHLHAHAHPLHHHHHHHHARSSSHAHGNDDSTLEAHRANGSKYPASATTNLGPTVAPGSFGPDSGGGPGRAVPTTHSSLPASLAAHVASLPGTATSLSVGDAGAAAAAAASLVSLATASTGTPNGQVRMWNLEALRSCVAWALDSEHPNEPLDLLDKHGAGAKKANKHTRNRLSRAFKKVFGVLSDTAPLSKAPARPGLSDSASMDTVETLAAAAQGSKGKDREGPVRDDERRKWLGARTASDGSLTGSTWTMVDDPNATSPSSALTRSELESEAGHGPSYEGSVRSFGTYGRSFDEDRRSAMSPLGTDSDARSQLEDPAALLAEVSRKAALRLALSSVVIPAGSAAGNTPGSLPGPSLPSLDDDRTGKGPGKKGKERSVDERTGLPGGAQASGQPGGGPQSSAGSGIGPVTGSSSGSPKPVLFYAIHEAAPGAKGAGTWYLALATTKTITVYEARPPKNDQRGGFLPISLNRNAGQSWTQGNTTTAASGNAGEARSWSLLRELYTPQAPKAITFAQASTTDIPLSTKEKGASLHHHQDGALKPQFAGGLAGPRGWMGADLSLLVTFGHRAVIIRLTDLNVRDFELMSQTWAGPLPPELRPKVSKSDLHGHALADEASALSLDPHGSYSGRGPPLAPGHGHHRRVSSSSQAQLEEKQNWIGVHQVDVKIILRQSLRSANICLAPPTGGGVPMALSHGAEAALGSSRARIDAQPTPVFASVLSPNAGMEQRAFDSAPLRITPQAPSSRPRQNVSASGSESATTNEDDEDSLADSFTEDADRSEVVYTATGRPAVLLRDRSVDRSTGSKSDPTLTVVDRAGPAHRDSAEHSHAVRSGRRHAVQPRRRERERHADAPDTGNLVSASLALVTKGMTTQILPLPLPADLTKPKPMDVLNWSSVPNAVSGWARVVGLERERTTGGVSAANMGHNKRRQSRGHLTPDFNHNNVASGAAGAVESIILHLNVTVLAFMASRVESQRTRVRMHVSLNFSLLRDAEIELLPMLDALVPSPTGTGSGPTTSIRPEAEDGGGPHPDTRQRGPTEHAKAGPEAKRRTKTRTNSRAYALGIARANDLCICADPPRIRSDSATFDPVRRPSLAEPQARRSQEFEYLSGLLVGLPHRGGVRPPSIAAVDVCRAWEMHGDGGVLAWDWRGGRDYRLFFVGAEV